MPALAPRTSARPAFEALENRTLMSAGDLDTTFAGDGSAQISFPGTTFEVQDVAVQSDGKVVAVGQFGTYAAASRLNADGSVDVTFGVGGLCLFNGTALATAKAVAIQGDGKALVVGMGDGKIGAARLNADGSLDSSFDSDGIVHTNVQDAARANDVAIQKDGKIVVVGRAMEFGFFSGLDEDFAVVRYNPDGSLDNTFDSDGKVAIGFGDGEEAFAVAINSDGAPDANPMYGTITVVGGGIFMGGSKFKAARLLPNGHLDTSFDGDGKLSTAWLDGACATGVSLQGGSAVVAGVVGAEGARNLGMVRYSVDGTIDISFGTLGNGRVEMNLGDNDEPVALVAGDNGSLMAGTVSSSGLVVGCFTRNGAPDTRFSGDGLATAYFGGANVAYPGCGIATGPGRQLVVAGGPGRVARMVDLEPTVGFLSFDTVASESGDTAAFLVIRDEPATTPLRVYLSTGGTATAPSLKLGGDYTTTGIVQRVSLLQRGAYVDIPANQTFAAVTITAVDDALVEGTELAVFGFAGSDSYDANPQSPSIALSIRDNDSYLSVIRTTTIPMATLALMAAPAPEAGAATGPARRPVLTDVTGDGVVNALDRAALRRRQLALFRGLLGTDRLIA